MAWTELYCNLGLATGANDGTSEANAWQSLSAANTGVAALSNAAPYRVNIKSTGTRVNLNSSAALTMNAAGTKSKPIWWRCYSSTIGDGGLQQVELTGNGTSTTFSGAYTVVEGFSVEKYNNQNGFFVSGSPSLMRRCRYISASGDYTSSSPVGASSMVNCIVIIKEAGNTTKKILLGGVGVPGTMVGCRLEGIPLGLDSYSSSMRVVNSVFANLRSDQATYQDFVSISRNESASGATLLVGNRFYNNPLSGKGGIYIDKLGDTGVADQVHLYGNVFEAMDYAFRHNSGSSPSDAHASVWNHRNFYYSLTSGYTTLNSGEVLMDNEALSGSPFAGASSTMGSGDYSLNGTSGAGALVRASGLVHINEPCDWSTLFETAVYEGAASSGGPPPRILVPLSGGQFPIF